MELATRKVHFAGLTPYPDEGWMLQVATNGTDTEEGFLRGKQYLLMDRDGKFSKAFRDTLAGGGVESVRLRARSPNLNSQVEGFVRNLKEECLERMIFFGEKSLRATTVAYMEHFLAQRNHQGMGDRLLIPGSEVGEKVGEVICGERLGGLLRYYYRKAAQASSAITAAVARAAVIVYVGACTRSGKMPSNGVPVFLSCSRRSPLHSKTVETVAQTPLQLLEK